MDSDSGSLGELLQRRAKVARGEKDPHKKTRASTSDGHSSKKKDSGSEASIGCGLSSLGDVLMGRLKAVEKSIDQGWPVARHLEAIPPPHASWANPREMELATKAESRSALLRGSLDKLKTKRAAAG